MVMDLYDSLLDEAAKALGIPSLKADHMGTCLIAIPNQDLTVYLEIDRGQENVILGAELGFTPPGRYRETIFTAALKTNRLPSSGVGIFAFNHKADQLVLFELLPLKELNGQKIAQTFTPFVEKALAWRSAILQGEPPPEAFIKTGRVSGSGIFGL